MGVHPGRPAEAADQELAEELPGLGGFRGGQTYWATIQAARRYTAPRIGRAVQRVANPVGATTVLTRVSTTSVAPLIVLLPLVVAIPVVFEITCSGARIRGTPSG